MGKEGLGEDLADLLLTTQGSKLSHGRELLLWNNSREKEKGANGAAFGGRCHLLKALLSSGVL